MDTTEKQIPFPPSAGFVAAVETGPKPDPKHTGDRMAACLTMRDLTWRERCVLMAIAFHDGPGGAWPAQERIGGIVGLPRTTVNEVIASLQRKGRLAILGKHGHGRATCEYTIAYKDGSRDPSRNPDSGSEPLSGFDGDWCHYFPDTNRKEPRRFAAGLDTGNLPDLCEPPGACKRAAFVEVGSECNQCGWRRHV